MLQTAVDAVAVGRGLGVAGAAQGGAQDRQRLENLPFPDRQAGELRNRCQDKSIEIFGRPLLAQKKQRHEDPARFFHGCGQPFVLAAVKAGFAEYHVDGHGPGSGGGQVIDGPGVKAARPGPGGLKIQVVEIDAFLVYLDQDDRGGARTAEKADFLVIDFFFEKAGDEISQDQSAGEDQRGRNQEAFQFLCRETKRLNLVSLELLSLAAGP